MPLVAGAVTVSPSGVATTVPNTLSKAIYDEFVNNYNADVAPATMPGGPESAPIKKNFAIQATRLATAIVSYITANAQVSTTLSVASVSGVTTGPGSSGPGSGTGTGTIS